MHQGVHEFAHSTLHAKTLVVDDVALVGTANMDNRSFRLDFEVAGAMFDEGLAEQLAPNGIFDACCLEWDVTV